MGRFAARMFSNDQILILSVSGQTAIRRHSISFLIMNG